MRNAERRLYAHDCTECIYLGAYRAHDLYYCVRALPTVIARFGPDGPEYVSGLGLAALDPILAEAKRRVGELGHGRRAV